jgi:hypothetical protein
MFIPMGSYGAITGARRARRLAMTRIARLTTAALLARNRLTPLRNGDIGRAVSPGASMMMGGGCSCGGLVLGAAT